MIACPTVRRVKLRLLGTVEADESGRPLPLGPRRDRFVLAVLALEAGRPVPVARLIELNWPVAPPRTAVNAIMVGISRLRGVLAGHTEIVRQGAGYALRMPPEDIDVHRFRTLVEQAADAGDGEKIALLDEALGLWSGPALDAVAPSEVRDRLCHRLDEARLTAIEDRLDAHLRLGAHRDVLAGLTTLIDEHPMRERLAGQLMLALYRAARPADALTVYRRVRERIGAEPGPQLRTLELAILRDDPAIAAPKPKPAPPPVPAQLPRAAAGFTGRAAQLRQLDRLLTVHPFPGTPAVIAGTAGVGKTALAVHWAHHAARKFPDGQLYLNLAGSTSLDALTQCLRSLGVPSDHIPTDLDAAAAAYRKTLACRRVLVLLDNADDADQVRPLLPASPQCLVVVTSRDRLSGLTAPDHLSLDVLSLAEAKALLVQILGAERVGAEPAVVDTLVRLCAYLPLALRIAAAKLLDEPGRPIADYVARLDQGDRLAALEVEQDSDTAVRLAFQLSLDALPAAARRLFRLLGLVPGPDFTVPAAAALIDGSAQDAERLLHRLATAHLIEQRVPDRYTFHDLLRLYAAERAAAEEPQRAAAIDRLMTFYRRGADAAARVLYPQMQRLPRTSAEDGPPTTVEPGWLDAERLNLVAAAVHGPAHVAWELSDTLRGYFWLRQHILNWLEVAEAGLAAAADHPIGAAAAHLSLAQVKRRLSRPEESVEHFDEAVRLAAEHGWPEGEAAALNSLADLYRTRGRLAEAADLCLRARAGYAAAGRPAGEAATWGNLGHISLDLGRLADAADQYGRAFALYTELGSPAGQAYSLASQGTTFRVLGRLDDAHDVLRRALQFHESAGSRAGIADTTIKLAELHDSAGRHAEAIETARPTVEVAGELGVRSLEAEALNVLGGSSRRLGDAEAAAGYHREARDLARELEYPAAEIAAITGLAAARLALGAVDTAAEEAESALALAQARGLALHEADAATVLAAIAQARGDDETAAGYTALAAKIDAETGYGLPRVS
jgi:DNA-binding SARP family transcriptional activator